MTKATNGTDGTHDATPGPAATDLGTEPLQQAIESLFRIWLKADPAAADVTRLVCRMLAAVGE